LENGLAALLEGANYLSVTCSPAFGQSQKYAKFLVQERIRGLVQRADVTYQPDDRDPAIVGDIQLPIVA
jgi:hypothetical protein